MKLEKKIKIEITKEERQALRGITHIVENISNTNDIEDASDILATIISGIVVGYNVISTSVGDILVKYDI